MTHERYGPLISALIDGELTPAQRSEVLAHLRTCPECQALLDDYRRLRSEIRALDQLSPPPAVATAVHDRLATEALAARRRRRLAALATVALAGLVAAVPLSEGLREATPPEGTARWTVAPAAAEASPVGPLAATSAPAAAVAGPFDRLYGADAALRARLGTASAPARSVAAAGVPFERGRMEWLADGRQIYVLYDQTRSWARFGEPTGGTLPVAEPAPAGLLRPPHTFGALWSEQAPVRERLGWATAPEQAHTGLLQRYERGLLLRGANGAVYALFDDGTWQRLEAP